MESFLFTELSEGKQKEIRDNWICHFKHQARLNSGVFCKVCRTSTDFYTDLLVLDSFKKHIDAKCNQSRYDANGKIVSEITLER